jgi:hypothetical protein
MVADGKQPSLEIHPKEIKGAWDVGYVLDLHTISSTMIGYNEFGHPESDTQTSPPGRTFQEGVPGEYAGAVSRVMATANWHTPGADEAVGKAA